MSLPEIPFEFGSLVATITNAFDLFKKFSDLVKENDKGEEYLALMQARYDALDAAIKAKERYAAVMQQTNELENEIRNLKAWSHQKTRYHLDKPFPFELIYLYTLKESMSEGEKPHWICANCYENGQRSILQQIREPKSGMKIIHCPGCKTDIHTNSHTIPIPSYCSA